MKLLKNMSKIIIIEISFLIYKFLEYVYLTKLLDKHKNNMSHLLFALDIDHIYMDFIKYNYRIQYFLNTYYFLNFPTASITVITRMTYLEHLYITPVMYSLDKFTHNALKNIFSKINITLEKITELDIHINIVRVYFAYIHEELSTLDYINEIYASTKSKNLKKLIIFLKFEMMRSYRINPDIRSILNIIINIINLEILILHNFTIDASISEEFYRAISKLKNLQRLKLYGVNIVYDSPRCKNFDLFYALNECSGLKVLKIIYIIVIKNQINNLEA